MKQCKMPPQLGDYVVRTLDVYREIYKVKKVVLQENRSPQFFLNCGVDAAFYEEELIVVRPNFSLDETVRCKNGKVYKVKRIEPHETSFYYEIERAEEACFVPEDALRLPQEIYSEIEDIKDWEFRFVCDSRMQKITKISNSIVEVIFDYHPLQSKFWYKWEDFDITRKARDKKYHIYGRKVITNASPYAVTDNWYLATYSTREDAEKALPALLISTLQEVLKNNGAEVIQNLSVSENKIAYTKYDDNVYIRLNIEEEDV